MVALVMLVSVCRALTRAFSTTAPDGSVTRPLTLAELMLSCAYKIFPRMTTATNTLIKPSFKHKSTDRSLAGEDGRAALLAGTMKRRAIPGFGLGLCGRMAYHSGEQRLGIHMQG